MKNKILQATIAALILLVLFLVFYRNDKLSSVVTTLNSINTDICNSIFSLPKDYQVLVASVCADSFSHIFPAEYNGYKAIDVVVTVTQPTIIIVTGYEQNVWNIKEAQSNLVKAVLLAGSYDQKIILNDSKAKVLGGKAQNKYGNSRGKPIYYGCSRLHSRTIQSVKKAFKSLLEHMSEVDQTRNEHLNKLVWHGRQLERSP